MSKEQIRCAVYTRKSSEEGLEQSFNSLEAQREACIAYIQSQKHEGWVPVKGRYDDGGFSGGNLERPAMQRLLDDIRAGNVEVVIVYKVDRLTRSLPDFAKIIEVFDSNKVSFVSVTQQFNTTTSMGRLTLNVLLSFAQFERELTGERIRDKVAASKKKGMWMGGVVPLGFDRVKHRLIVNPADAETVREIFRQYLRLGSVSRLKEYLEQQQVRSKIRTGSTGRTWGGTVYSRGALYKILGNRIYIGRIVHRDQSYAGLHEPIIDEKLWDQVAARLETNKQARRTRRPRATPGLLTGLLRDTNGVRFTPTHAVKKGKRYRYYTSQAVIQQRGTRPQLARYPAGELEALVTAELYRLLGSLDKYLTASEITPDAEVAVQRAQDLAAQWPQVSISRQQELIRAVVKTVTVGQKNLWIEVDKVKLITMLVGPKPNEFATTDEGESVAIRLTVDVRPLRRGGELRIYTPDDSSTHHKPNPSLVKMIARARKWYEQLISGEITSIEQLGQQTGFNRRYLRKILQCATLSPEVMQAILSGREAQYISVKRLLDGDVPLDWQRQTQLFLIPLSSIQLCKMSE